MRKRVVGFLFCLFSILTVITSSCLAFKDIQYSIPQITPLFPAHKSLGCPTDIELTWEATSGVFFLSGKRLEIGIKEYAVFIAKFSEKYEIPAITSEKTIRFNDLEYAETYKWLAVVLQNDGKTATSTEWIFTTVQKEYSSPQIELKYPAEGTSDCPLSTRLVWEAFPGNQTNLTERNSVEITGYEVYITKWDEEYSSPVIICSPDQKEYETQGLEYASNYKWKVKAIQSDGKETTSAERRFSTYERHYEAPEILLVSPKDLSDGHPVEILFKWQAKPGKQENSQSREESEIIGFDLYISKTCEDYRFPIKIENGKISGYLISKIDYSTEYKWKVVAYQSDGKTATSSDRRFSTEERKYNPPQITISSPKCGTEDLLNEVELTWEATPGKLCNISARNPSITEYRIYLAAETLPYTENPSTCTEKSLILNGLALNTTYRWQVCAVQSDGNFASTTEATFTTLNKAVLRYDALGKLQQGYSKVSDAVAEADDKDEIIIREGEILSNEDSLIEITAKELTLKSTGTAPFTLDMSGKNHRAFNLSEGSSVTLTGAVIQNGNALFGGGISIVEATLTIIDSEIKGCTANGSSGGGIYVGDSAALFIHDAKITSNSSNGSGGGIYVAGSGRLVVENTVISSNTSTSKGAGIFTDENNIYSKIHSSTITYNLASVSGGGIYVCEGAQIKNADEEYWKAGLYPGTTDDPSDIENNNNVEINNFYYGNCANGDTIQEGANISFIRTPFPEPEKIAAHAKIDWVRVYSTDFSSGTVLMVFTDPSSLTEVASSSYIYRIVKRPEETFIQADFEVEAGVQYWVTVQSTPLQYAQSIKKPVLSVNTPGNFSNSTPTDNLLEVQPAITFEWTQSEGADRYTLFFGTQSDPEQAVSGIVDTTYSTSLLENTLYYWKVSGFDSYGSSETSEIKSFRTAQTGTVTLFSKSGNKKGEFDLVSQAVNVSENGDIIKVRSGETILETKQISLNSTEVTIISSGEEKFTIDMNADSSNKRRAFNISGTASITIINANITNGYQNSGGGIYISGENAGLFLYNCEITQNTAASGGGINCYLGKVFIDSSSIISNNAVGSTAAKTGKGAGIYNWSGTVTLNDSTVSLNTAASYGGGIYTFSTSVSAAICFSENSTLSGNFSGLDGGGIYLFSTTNGFSELNLINSTISENLSNSYGGGIYQSSDSGSTTLNSTSTIIKNNAAASGGGMYKSQTSSGISHLNAVEIEISENTASQNGGGIYSYNGIININSGIIENNEAVNSNGGGIYRTSGELKTNNFSWSNTGNKSYEFSVNSIGLIEDFKEENPLKVMGNSSKNTDTKQLKW